MADSPSVMADSPMNYTPPGSPSAAWPIAQLLLPLAQHSELPPSQDLLSPPPEDQDVVLPPPPEGQDVVLPPPPEGQDVVLPPSPPPPPEDPLPPPSLELEDLIALPPVVMLQKGVVPARRHKKGEAKDAPGKESWVHGTKLLFFERRKAEYLAAAGEFYTKMARLYVLKYGYNLRDNEDLAVDVDDPPDEAANVVVNKKAAPGDNYAAFHKTLRTRIGNWYRRKYGGLLKSDKAAFAELFTGILDGAPRKPQRGQLLHCYSRHFFESRVKERFEERFKALKRRCTWTGEKPPTAIAIQNAVTKEVWEEETLGFREEVKLLWEHEYQRALKGWEASLADSPTRTPAELAASLENAAYYLQPFVDAVAQRFGMNTSLLLCGPIGKMGGVVGMQSVHAGTTRGLASVKWPQWDKARFKEVETRMVEFCKGLLEL
ncbi:hypothetical protein C8F04DRAFT_1183975 [Mycena alexandri]|uniref:Uncharacterized protein n=1 Tax=Mycena alexandri TaxID=1745969 RepID=A0AAD6SW50_9AGAR|nr:hypothetical protein C8F04DRAFT_1183975 [Mycena alexandri]